jgi:hypothetical protein
LRGCWGSNKWKFKAIYSVINTLYITGIDSKNHIQL